MDFQLGDLLLDLLVVAFGAIALLNGRRLYWVFVGIGGAIVGLWLSIWLMPDRSEWIHISLMLALGLAGVWVSYRFEKLALYLAAFVLGGYVLQFLLLDGNLISSGGTGDFATVLVGGILGVAFEVVYKERSLIVISSFSGAALIVSVLTSTAAFEAALFAGLAAVGMLLQSSEWIDFGSHALDPPQHHPDF